MAPRFAWLGAALVVSAAACANIWGFSDLQVGEPGEDAATFQQDTSVEDSTSPDVRTDGASDVHTDGRALDATLDAHNGDAGDALSDGFPADQECPTTRCEPGQCVDTQTDPLHCGSCATACPRGAMCTAGACKCPAAQSTACSGVCVDVASDHGNCGGCGNACPTGQRCSNRTCVPCQSTDKMCSGICVDTTTDISNCGNCGMQCPSGASCVNSACVCPATDPATCAGARDAGTQCVNLTNDNNNCGSCGNLCSLSHATAACTFFTCTISACSPGYVDCNRIPSDGCEVNTTSDTNNCGGCARVCAPANATPSCSNSSCLIGMCSPGYADCDHLASNGCEVSTATDPTNCGTCGTTCNLPHATAGCNGGSCTVASCNTGWADCDGNPANGCETDLSQPAHCGTCGNACATGMLCSGGSCVSMCVAPMPTLCNGSYCANTTNDVNNCGTCGHVCSLANATATCTSSACAVASCNTGYADCNKTASDGCEVNTTNDVNNCKTCANKCNLTNATAVCSASACAISLCNMGFKDCDGVAANGCEVNLMSDTSNCGMCATKCATNGNCNDGGCGCPGGTLNCGAAPGTCATCPTAPTNGSTGCLVTDAGASCVATCSNPNPTLCSGPNACVNTTSDNNNCGACDAGCSTTGSSCSGSMCQCPALQHACTGACVSNSATSSCGTMACTACQVPLEGGTATCDGSACGASCPGSLTLCTVSGNLGCVDPMHDPNNCGTCGNACDGGGGGCDAGTCM